jgi:hypothetical protein
MRKIMVMMALTLAGVSLSGCWDHRGRHGWNDHGPGRGGDHDRGGDHRDGH